MAKSNVQQGYASILKMPQYADWPKSIKHLPPKRLFGIVCGYHSNCDPVADC
jgi:hypothetical protein